MSGRNGKRKMLRRSRTEVWAGALAAVLGLSACGTGTVEQESFDATAQELKGTSDPSLSLGAWTATRAVTAKVKTPTGGAAKTACVSLTAVTAKAGDAWETCAGTAVSGLSTTKTVSAALTLADRDGLQTVWVRFKGEGADSTKVESVASSTIVLDRQAPTEATVGVDGEEKRVGVRIALNKPASDVGGSGVRGYQVVAVAAAATAATPSITTSNCATKVAKPMTCTLETTGLFCNAVGTTALSRGDKVALQVCATDNVGNVTNGVTLAATVAAVDPNHRSPFITNYPSLLNDTGISASDGMTTDGTFSFPAQAFDGAVVASWCMSIDDGPCTYKDLAAKERAATVSIVGTFPVENARKVIQIKVKDSLGTESANQGFEVTVDRVAPKKPESLVVSTTGAAPGTFSISVENAESADALDLEPSMVFTASEGKAPAAKCAEQTGSVRLSRYAQNVFSAGTNSVDAPLVPGRRYFVMACAVDAAGNVSEGTATTAAVLLKRSSIPPNPIGRPLEIVGVPYVNGRKYVSGKTLQARTKLTAYGSSTLTHYLPVFVPEGESAPQEPAPTAVWLPFKKAQKQQVGVLDITLPTSLANGKYSLVVFVKDDNENVSGTFINDWFEYDTAAPTLALKNAVTIGGFGGIAVQVDVEVTNVAAAGALVYSDTPYASELDLNTLELRFKSGIAAPTATGTSLATCRQIEALTFRCLTPFAFALSATASANKVSFLATIRDFAGNKGSGKFEATASLPLQADLEAPGLGGSLGVFFNGGWAYLTLSEPATAPDLAGYLVVYAPGGVAPADCDSGTNGGAFGPGQTLELTPTGGTGTDYSFRVCAVDFAGNVSAGVSVVPG